ncbi:MAG: cobaltochelatase subunit CobT, partial [Alphaproteobacteria bacterium]|nr:cobaltochelatase subunit CobT [Alphaproteobacteria bacterium]
MGVNDPHDNKRREKAFESFKTAIAASVRAMSGKKGVDVTYSAGENSAHERLSNLSRVRLPLPERNLTLESASLTRGAADARALRLHHHDNSLHLKNAPLDLTAQAAFDALEQARVEALGASQMKGVADNLHATLQAACKRAGYARMENREEINTAEALHVLARLALTGEDVPAGADKLAALWQPFLAEKIGVDGLESLRPHLADQQAFARQARRLIEKMDMQVGDDSEEDQDEQREGEDVQEGDGDADLGTDEDNTEESGEQSPQDGDDAVPDAEDSDHSQSGPEELSEEDMTGDMDGDDPGAPRAKRGEGYI